MKSLLKLFILFLLSSCATQQSMAQTDGSKKAQEAYKQADEDLVFGRYEAALVGFEKAISIDSKYVNAHLQLANLYQNLYLEYDKAIQHYESVLKIDPSLVKSYYEGAKCYLYIQEWGKAKAFALQYQEKRVVSPYSDWASQVLLESIELAQQAIANPVEYDPQNLGPAINSEQAEYFPSITADNEFLYFTVNNENDRYPNEDIYTAQFVDGKWQDRESVSTVNRKNAQEGAHSITQDGRYLFFASDRMEDNQGRFDIYIAKKVGDEWRVPVNMGNTINSRHWESQPVISADAKQLFLVRKSNEGFGGSDIYVSKLDETGRFGKLENLGKTINTPGDEQRPYLHPDGKTLYFASNGHPGLGKTDVYKSTLQKDGTWTKPVNLGYPINTSEVEFGLYVAADGKSAYISSDREGGYGDMDIYSFDLPVSARPEVVLSVKGVVKDIVSREFLKANIKILDLKSGEVYKTLGSDDLNGSFLVTLPAGKNYAYQANLDGYLPFSETFSLKNISEGAVVELEALMTKIEKGQEFVLKNIFFDSGEAILKEESLAELNVLVEYLESNEALFLEIGGHTDSEGTEEQNLALSMQRAKAVYLYLLAEGAKAGHLSYKGYGEGQALVPNDSDENKKKNRRTAFKVM